MPYLVPDAGVVAAIDAPPTPVPVLGPGGRFLLLVRYESHPPVSLLAKPHLPLAGVRLDPEIRGRQRTVPLTGITVIRLADGVHTEVQLPPGAVVSVPGWSPDGYRFAFTIDEPDGIGVWVGDATDGSAQPLTGLRVSDTLSGGQLTGTGPVRWSRDGASLLVLAAPPSGSAVVSGAAPEGPRVDETSGKQSQMATYQDLLATAADEDRFERLATTTPVRYRLTASEVEPLGPPGLYWPVEESPDGEHLLVHRLKRPFSFRVPYAYFARRVEVWSSAGAPEAVIADLPVSDEVPRQGVPTGARGVSWEERAPARLAWIEALDGGDPVAPADHRDKVMGWAAPFLDRPTELFRVRQRCVGWYDLAEPGQVLMIEHDRDRRWRTTWLCDLFVPERNRVLFDHSTNDAYADRGSPVLELNPDGTRTALTDGTAIYLRGQGATPEGDRPFLDRFDLETGRSERLVESSAEGLDQVLGFADMARTSVLVRHESPSEPPNFVVASLSTTELGPTGGRPVTAFPDPHPELTGMTKRLITHDRGDGVQLTGMLCLPRSHEPARDGPLPLVIWAYPLDYGDAGTAGQVRGTTQAFTRLAALSPTWFVTRGYAVLNDATMPIIGDPETMNDTYIEQITAAARAHVDVLDHEGIIDRSRVVIGGHSYGGFMTANLLAHTDLFSAGIARSGAYNRTLTPFGFQSERRSFWEVPEVYDRVSPFRYAHLIRAPLLLVHGQEDNNSGTFTIQSERLFQAIQGTGGTARLVLLPHESHGYLGRESVLHVLAEQFDWLDRWVPAGGLPVREPNAASKSP